MHAEESTNLWRIVPMTSQHGSEICRLETY